MGYDTPIAVTEAVTAELRGGAIYINRPIAVLEHVEAVLTTVATSPPLSVSVSDSVTVQCVGYATLVQVKRQRWHHKKH